MQDNILSIDFFVPNVGSNLIVLPQGSLQEKGRLEFSCERFRLSTKEVFFRSIELDANVSSKISAPQSVNASRSGVLFSPVRTSMILWPSDRFLSSSSISNIEGLLQIHHVRAVEIMIFHHFFPHPRSRFSIHVLCCGSIDTDWQIELSKYSTHLTLEVDQADTVFL
jgi:hypothetical protein